MANSYTYPVARPEGTLTTDRKSNILGGAALLAETQGDKPFRLDDYFGAVDGKGGHGNLLKAVAGVGAGELYAEQVFSVLRRGASKTLLDGEQVDLRAQEG